MARILVVSNHEIHKHISPADCVPPVEKAFQSMSSGQAELPATYHDVSDWGIQDAVVAEVIYDIAEREGLGTAVEL